MREKGRFLLTGAYNTAFGYAVFVILYQFLHETLHYLVIAVISHAIAVSNSFLLQRWLVFRDSGPIMPAFVRFNIATAGSLVFGLIGMAALVDGASLHPFVAQAIVTLVSVLAMYVTHRGYTFRHRTDDDDH